MIRYRFYPALWLMALLFSIAIFIHVIIKIDQKQKSMNQSDIFPIAEAINKISAHTDTPVQEIIDTLIGIAWSEEEASDIEEYLTKGK